jgi:hypothetical protein
VTPDISAYMSDASGGARDKAPLSQNGEDYLNTSPSAATLNFSE